jgi:hypothetical protein
MAGCQRVVALSGGCAGENQRVSGSQELTHPAPPPAPLPPPESPPPPPAQVEMVAQAAAPPADPPAWAPDLADVHFAYD